MFSNSHFSSMGFLQLMGISCQSFREDLMTKYTPQKSCFSQQRSSTASTTSALSIWRGTMLSPGLNYTSSKIAAEPNVNLFSPLSFKNRKLLNTIYRHLYIIIKNHYWGTGKAFILELVRILKNSYSFHLMFPLEVYFRNCWSRKKKYKEQLIISSPKGVFPLTIKTF